MKRFYLLPIFALLLAYTPSQAQQLELSCPAGYTPLRGSSVTFDVATGKLRQWECVDSFGNVNSTLVNGGGAAALTPIQLAASQTGATADVQISNAIAALPGGSGIVWANYSTNQTWSACPTWGAGNVHVVLYPVSYAIAVNCTIPATVSLQFTQGAILAPAAAVVVTVNGSAIAGNRQKIINTANGTVTFNGSKDIYVGWYGAPQDGVTDDAPAVNATLTANPGKNVYMLKTASTPCSSGSGGGCFGTFDGVFNSQVTIPENTTFGGVTPGGWPAGPVQIKCSTSLTVACVWIPAVGFNTKIHDIFLYGQKCWDTTNNNTFDVPAAMDGPGPDGLLITGGQASVSDFTAYCFERHGIAILGNNSMGDGGQPDFFKFQNITSYGNRAWGIYAVGGDSNAGVSTFIATYQNMMGGIFDNSQLGSTWTGTGSHVDNRNGIIQSGTQNISSITDTAGTVTVVLVSGITTSGFTLGAWVTIAGTTNYNGTFKVTQFTDTAHFQFQLTGTFATENAGTASYASSASIYAAIKALGGQFAKQGAYASNDGSSSGVWINPYCESTSQAPTWGNFTLVIGGLGGHGCTANFTPGTSPPIGNVMGIAVHDQVYAYTSGLLLNWAQDSNKVTLDLQSGATVDTIPEENRYLDHTGAIKFRYGMPNGPGGAFEMNSTAGNLGCPFENDPNGTTWVSGCLGASVPLNLQWNATGPVNFFSSAANPPEQFTNDGFGHFNGGTILTDNGSFGSKQTNAYAACETSLAATTLSTIAATTDTGQNCLPANAIIDAVVFRVISTITTATSYTIGDATTAARFCASQSGGQLSAGATAVCFVQADQTGAAGPRQVSAAKVRVTLNITPGAGSIRLIVYYHTWTSPTS